MSSNGVTVSYYGQLATFQPTDFYNGSFESWTNNVFASFGGGNPCGELVGMPTAVTITQNSIFNTIGIINSLNSIADLAGGSTNMLSGSLGSISNSSNEGGGSSGRSNKNNNQNTNGNNGNNSSGSGTTTGGNSNTNGSTANSGNSSQGSGSSSSSSSSSSSNSGGAGSSGNGNSGSSSSGGSGGSGSGSQTSGQSSETAGSGGSGNPTEGSGNSGITEESSGQTNVLGGTTNSVRSESDAETGASGGGGKSAGKSEGGKPTVVASSDFVGFNFQNSEVKTGLKATGGYTALRWDGVRAHGILADYTSAQLGPNITGFYAWLQPRRTTLLSGTLTLGFEGLGSQYITVAIGQMRSFDKIPKLKVVYMATGSMGYVYKEPFIGTAAIAGGMYDWKANKRIDIKFMGLFIYAPFVSYYDDIILKSPYVVMPSIGTNIGITKRFKFNINAGGAWAIKEAAINYTVTCGTRLLIGQ